MKRLYDVRCWYAWSLLLGLTSLSTTVVRPCAGQETTDSLRSAIASVETYAVSDVAFDKVCGILVGDQQEGVWRILLDGSTVQLNRPGQGPGEFLNLSCVAWGENGDILIGSKRNGRIVRYSNELEFKDQFSFGGVCHLATGKGGHIYVNTVMDQRGPIVELDSTGSFLRSLSEWRASEDLVGVPGWRSASEAILRWNSNRDILVAGYIQDATFQIYSEGELVSTFRPNDPAIAAHDRLRAQTIGKNPGQLARTRIMTMSNFFIVNDGAAIFAVLGGRPIIMSLEGQVQERASQPSPTYQMYFPGPDQTVIAQEKATWKLTLLILDDVFRQD